MAAAWHLLAKMRGLNDVYLDEVAAALPEAERAKAEGLARKWAATTPDIKRTADADAAEGGGMHPGSPAMP